MNYAGDISPRDTWTMLNDNPEAIMVDVRTTAEWTYVGFADLTAIDKKTGFVEWVSFPAMARNEKFIDQVRALVPDPATPIVMVCRSGVRSIAAAEAMTAIGYSACYNMLEGFEGDKDHDGHRGQTGGWKQAGLAWAQG
jgi:rhodanese-related sulfurtransferase